MSLASLNKELHSRDAHLDRTRFSETPLHPAEELEAEKAAFQKTEGWTPSFQEKGDLYLVSPGQSRRKKLMLWGGVLVFLLIALGVGAFFGVKYYLQNDRVLVALQGPREAKSGEPVTYTITYTNGNRAPLKSAKLLLTFPESFTPEPASGLTLSGARAERDLGEIAPGASLSQAISGTFFGPKGTAGILRATLQYVPTGSSSAFEAAGEFSVTVATAPLELELSSPRELGSGQALDYVATYRNTSDRLLKAVHLKFAYPAEFTWLGATPEASDGSDDFSLGDLAPGSTGKVVVHGTLVGNPDENKGVSAWIGTLGSSGQFQEYARAEQGTRITSSPLVITQTVNGEKALTALPGDTLEYRLNYKNQGVAGLRDVVITESIDTTYLDVSRLKLTSGAYNAEEKKIYWRAADLPALSRLEPGAAGEIVFTIPVQKAFHLGPGEEKHISIRALATIDSPDIQTTLGQNKIIGSNLMEVKLGALVAVGLSTSYDDKRLAGSGPIPPKVGQTTTYTVEVSLENSSNELGGNRVVLKLPSSVSYANRSVPEDASVQWNERTHELAWDPGTLSPGRPKELLFQVSVTPNASDAGRPMVLVAEAHFTGKERFTGRDIDVTRPALDNTITGSNFESSKDGTVAP
jgi:hypothetical protein